jgi:hypothetical protein
MFERDTDYMDICPLCKEGQPHMEALECRYCGWPIGPDWETVEIDLDTRVIVRTVIPAQAAEGQQE